MDDATVGPVGVDDPAVQNGETRSTDRRRLWRIGAQKVATHNHSSVLDAPTVKSAVVTELGLSSSRHLVHNNRVLSLPD